VRVPAPVQTLDELHIVEGRVPVEPQAAQVFDLKEVARQMQVVQNTAPKAAKEGGRQHAPPSGIPGLPPSQYPQGAAALSAVSPSPGETRPYVDAYTRVAAQLLSSELERDARRQRMARRQAELLTKLQVEAR
jgi:hypothetical protein